METLIFSHVSCLFPHGAQKIIYRNKLNCINLCYVFPKTIQILENGNSAFPVFINASYIKIMNINVDCTKDILDLRIETFKESSTTLFVYYRPIRNILLPLPSFCGTPFAEGHCVRQKE